MARGLMLPETELAPTATVRVTLLGPPLRLQVTLMLPVVSLAAAADGS